MKESRTDGEISLLTDADIAQELSPAVDKIPSVAVVNKLAKDLEEGIIIPRNAYESATAAGDELGRSIHETYATKAEVSEQMGDIETALDGIIAIQNALIGGEA
jgi:hypothetical protein